MGVRLYPILKQGVTIAELLGLPNEAQERYNNHNANRPTDLMDMDAQSDWYDAMDEDVEAINCFENNGWGKFYPCDWQKDGQYVSNSGSEMDRNKWVDVFITNGHRFGIEREEAVNIINGKPNFTDKLDGVMWC